MAARNCEWGAQLVRGVFEEPLLRFKRRLEAIEHPVDGGRHRTDLVPVLEPGAQAERIGSHLVGKRGDRLQRPQTPARGKPRSDRGQHHAHHPGEQRRVQQPLHRFHHRLQRCGRHGVFAVVDRTTLTLKLPDGRSIVPPRSCPAKRPDARALCARARASGVGAITRWSSYSASSGPTRPRRGRSRTAHRVVPLPCSAPSAPSQLAGVRPQRAIDPTQGIAMGDLVHRQQADREHEQRQAGIQQGQACTQRLAWSFSSMRYPTPLTVSIAPGSSFCRSPATYTSTMLDRTSPRRPRHHRRAATGSAPAPRFASCARATRTPGSRA